MGVGTTVFLDGEFLSAEEASISPFDRAFLFGHAAYEVTAVYNGKLIDAEGHMRRLADTLAGIELPMPASAEDLTDLHIELIERNELEEGLIYLQVSAGAYEMRDFAGPDTFTPTVFLFTTKKQLIDTPIALKGARAILIEDTRWKRRDMKTTQLLSQALAYRAAQKAGAFTAWMVEEDEITEAASANAWIVKDGVAITRPLGSQILPGITRERVVAELARKGIRVEERAFSPQEAQSADEAFTTSAGALILPITHIDNVSVAGGQPGPVTRHVQQLYRAYVGAA